MDCLHITTWTRDSATTQGVSCKLMSQKSSTELRDTEQLILLSITSFRRHFYLKEDREP